MWPSRKDKARKKAARMAKKQARQAARQSRKSTRQKARQGRKQTRADRRTTVVGMRHATKQARIEQKGAAGFWSPEAVQARQGTIQAGLGTVGDLASAYTSTLTGGLSGDLFGAGAGGELVDFSEYMTTQEKPIPWIWIGGGAAVLGVLFLATRKG